MNIRLEPLPVCRGREAEKLSLRSVEVAECGQVGGRVARAGVWLVCTATFTVWEQAGNKWSLRLDMSTEHGR